MRYARDLTTAQQRFYDSYHIQAQLTPFNFVSLKVLPAESDCTIDLPLA